jgi:hypothetical protein
MRMITRMVPSDMIKSLSKISEFGLSLKSLKGGFQIACDSCSGKC